MFKYILLFFIIPILFLQCKQKEKAVTLHSPSTDTSAFFPVNNFIKEDIKDIEQNPYHLYKIVNHHPGSRDSSTISIEEFLKLANNFLSKDITTTALKPLFHESVFHDLTTKSITINYTAIDSSTDIQYISVLLDDKTNKFKRAFIRSSYTNGDSLFIEQNNWKAGKSFQIIKSATTKSGTLTEIETTVIWNDKPYQ